MRQVKDWILGGLLAVTLTATASATDYQKGERAYSDKDYATAITILTPLAEAGDTKAQNLLGLMYEFGPEFGGGIKKDEAKAAKWYRRAAEAENPVAQYNLAVLYVEGRGVTRDFHLAYMWFSISANLGVERAAEDRASLARRMTSTQIDEARKITQQCRAQNYKNCEQLSP